jgi:Protein of unknown function (DUF2934)
MLVLVALDRNSVSSATIVSKEVSMATDKRIRSRAWQLWDQAGRPVGRDDEFSLQAEKEIREIEESRELANEPPPILPG